MKMEKVEVENENTNKNNKKDDTEKERDEQAEVVAFTKANVRKFIQSCEGFRGFFQQ